MNMQDGLGPKKGRVDWRKISSISNQEIEEQAALEKQRLGIKDEHLSARPVFKCPDIKQMRDRLGLSQNQFADTYALSRRTIQQWEQKRSEPDQPARILLRAIEKEPKLMERIIGGLRHRTDLEPRPVSALLDQAFTSQEWLAGFSRRNAVKSVAATLLKRAILTRTQCGVGGLVITDTILKGTLRTTKDPNSERSFVTEK